MSNLSQILADSNWGQESARINQNFQNLNADLEKVKSATTKFKGYFISETGLKSKYPSPKEGDTAWVGEPYPGTVYDVQTDGQWHNTGKAPDTGSVELQDYAKKAELTELEGKVGGVGYVTCDTAAGTAAKVITVTGLSNLTTGIRLLVKMTNNNTATNSTLNINSLGAKPLYYNNTRVSGDNAWEAGEIVDIYYDGANFYSGNFQGGSGEGGNLILVWNTDAATTRKQVKQSDRKSLLQISYKDGDGNPVNEQYIGTTFDDTEWAKDENWIKIADSIDIQSIDNDINDIHNIIMTEKTEILESLEIVKTYEGYALKSTGEVASGFSTYSVMEYNINDEIEHVAITGVGVSSTSFATVIIYKDNAVVKVLLTGVAKLYENEIISLPKDSGANKLRLMTEKNQKNGGARKVSIANVTNFYTRAESEKQYENKVLIWDTDVETTRKKIPIDERKSSMILSYKDESLVDNFEMFVGNDFSDNEWIKDENWAKIKENIIEYVADSTPIQPLKVNKGYALKVDGTITVSSPFDVCEYNIKGISRIFITGFSVVSSLYACAVALDSSGQAINVYFAGEDRNVVNEIIFIPNNAETLRVMRYTSDIDCAYKALKKFIFYTKEETYNKNEIANIIQEYWLGKKLWWCGTSIPAGEEGTLGDEKIEANYPSQVAKNLGAEVYNVAVGASMCRANVRTGDYKGASLWGISSALSMTDEEVEYFIDNYETIRNETGNGWPETLSDYYKGRLREASFEKKLIPYLNGTYPSPDLFIFDHGHNDFDNYLPSGESDITLEPTQENISSGILAEDRFMTNNDNANLVKFFGSLDNIPAKDKEKFIASINRNCFIGSVNFLITLIFKYQPQARIIIISNYGYKNSTKPNFAPVVDAQKYIADSWAIPICEIYKYLGYNNHIIPGSKNWFNETFGEFGLNTTTDVTCYKINLPDDLHPHSDKTGHAIKIYAGILTEFIKKCR